MASRGQDTRRAVCIIPHRAHSLCCLHVASTVPYLWPTVHCQLELQAPPRHRGLCCDHGAQAQEGSERGRSLCRVHDMHVCCACVVGSLRQSGVSDQRSTHAPCFVRRLGCQKGSACCKRSRQSCKETLHRWRLQAVPQVVTPTLCTRSSLNAAGVHRQARCPTRQSAPSHTSTSCPTLAQRCLWRCDVGYLTNKPYCIHVSQSYAMRGYSPIAVARDQTNTHRREDANAEEQRRRATPKNKGRINGLYITATSRRPYVCLYRVM